MPTVLMGNMCGNAGYCGLMHLILLNIVVSFWPAGGAGVAGVGAGVAGAGVAGAGVAGAGAGTTGLP